VPVLCDVVVVVVVVVCIFIHPTVSGGGPQDMSYDDSIMDFNPEAANGIVMEGYLYKRASNTFKTWSRCCSRLLAMMEFSRH